MLYLVILTGSVIGAVAALCAIAHFEIEQRRRRRAFIAAAERAARYEQERASA